MVIHCLEKGSGSLKHYHYWANRMKLARKEDIFTAIDLKLTVVRKDKITNEFQQFNYETKRFE